MKPNDTPPTAPANPIEQNELDMINALANEETTQQQTAEIETATAATDARAARVARYAIKISPFVNAYGARMRYPLAKQEADQLTNALADVAAEVIPEGDTPPNPWTNLLGVCLAIAIPRVILAMKEKAQAQQTPEASSDKKAAEAPAATKKQTGDPMLDGLNKFETGNRKPN